MLPAGLQSAAASGCPITGETVPLADERGTGDIDETLGGSPAPGGPAVPADLPEHSLVSYNPNRTRFTRKPPDPADAESTLLTEQSPRTGGGKRDRAPVPQEEADRHRLVRLIGRGGCGEVWEAIQVQLDRPVAVKTLREDLLVGEFGDASRDDLVGNFREEALIAARLDHPNIVPVYDYGHDGDGAPQLSMKLVRGEPWDRLLRADRAELNYDDFLARHLPILSAIANAVAFAHSRQIVHRDIKPSQVMVGEFGEVLLMDWGLAVLVGEDGAPDPAIAERPQWFSLPTLSTASSPAGTPAYMAPEQTRPTAADVGPWTDVYLLGGCLYCILTGSAPHEGPVTHEAFLQASRGEVRDPLSYAEPGGIPHDLAALALQALAPEPRDRVPSAEEFVRRLDDWISGASRRRESQRLTAQILAESAAPRANYSAHAAFIDRIQRAAGLWPGNPDVPGLRAVAFESYAELALSKGDLLLALSQAELLPESSRRAALLERIRAAGIQRQRTRRLLRAAVVAVVVLLAMIIVGGTVSLRRIDRERDEAVAQKNNATRALGIAEAARKDAEAAQERASDQQLYAQIRYATSLVDAGRHEMARAVLFSVPEDSRSWEWAYLLDRSHQALAEFPFSATEVSAEGDYFYVDSGDKTIAVRDTMAGALVARLDAGTTQTTILPPRRDTHVDAIAGDRILRFAPPSWEAKLLAQLPAPPRFAKRTVGGDNIAAMFPDGSAAVYSNSTGERLVSTPPVPLEPIGIDADDGCDRFLVAYKELFRVYRISDGALEHSVAGWLANPASPGLTDFGQRVAMIEGRNMHIYDLATGNIADTYMGGPSLVTHPRCHYALQMPAAIVSWSADVGLLMPVGNAESAQAAFFGNDVVGYWGGANGEAGVFNLTDKRTVAEIRGAPGQIERMWVALAKDYGGAERVFTVTSDGTTQAWLGSAHKTIAELPGQWSSFRRKGRHAVSITSFDSRVIDLDSGSGYLRSGTMFSITRGIEIDEPRDRVFSFGYGVLTGHVFGWEVQAYGSGKVLRRVRAGKEQNKLPYLWDHSGDRVAIFWKPNEPGELLSAEDGSRIAAIAPTSAAATALLATTGGTLLVGDNDGLVKEIALEDGRELRSISTGAPVWTMKLEEKSQRLVVSGGDSRWREYSWGSAEPKPLAERVAGTEPAVLLDFSSDGTRLLALTRNNEVSVWSHPGGDELLRFRIDSGVYRMQLNAEGTRIFGLGETGLLVWDLKGREVARIPDVIDFSLDSRRLLIRTSIQKLSRDVVVELPPYRTADFPGNGSMPFEQRFALWRRDQHRNWWERRTLSAAPLSIAAARSSVAGTVADGRAKLIGDIDFIFQDIGPRLAPDSLAVVDLMKRLGALYACDPKHDWYHFAGGIWDAATAGQTDQGPRLLLETSPYSRLRILRQAAARKGVLLDGNMWLNSVLAGQLAEIGYAAEAKALAIRTQAILRCYRSPLKLYEQRILDRIIGDAPVPEAPPHLQALSAHKSSRADARQRLQELGAGPIDAAALDSALKAMPQELDAAMRAWIDVAAPFPDLAAEMARVRASFPPAPPDSMPLAEFMGDVLDRLEREQLGGLSREEARARARSRFDESVARAAAERTR